MRLARAANRLLAPFGLSLQRRTGSPRASVDRALEQTRALGLAPATVIDVGAAYGDWAKLCARVFPDAHYLLVEPLSEFAPFLERRRQELGAATLVSAAAGRSSGTTTLHVHRDLVGTSLRSEPGLAVADRQVEVVSIDDAVAAHGLPGPYLIKLDVQGAEIDVLAGAGTTLRATELVQLESLFFPFYEGAAEFPAVVAALNEAGFAVYDLFDLGYRPLDGALAQADVLFVPANGPLREQRTYATPDQRRALDASLTKLYEQRRESLGR